jgi:hypothetical protein
LGAAYKIVKFKRDNWLGVDKVYKYLFVWEHNLEGRYPLLYIELKFELCYIHLFILKDKILVIKLLEKK